MICDLNKCTMCQTCIQSCPKNCITICENELGCLYPKIDESLCINCGICKKKCPQNNESDFNTFKMCYSAVDKNEHEREKVASGGVATLLSRHIIENGGVVFGCYFDNSINLKFHCATTIEQLERFKGSKYTQGDINDCYKMAKDFLEKGTTVLFIGTPCQIDGLNFYLEKKWDNLFTVDLVCHGVPANKYLKEYVKKFENKFSVDNVSFRGHTDFVLKLYSNDKIMYQKSYLKDPYYFAFCNHIFYNEACYNCKYATEKGRTADITLGDFWGLGKNKPTKNTYERPSVVLINTDMGKSLFDKITQSLIYEEREIQEAIACNGNLIYPSPKHKLTNYFNKKYPEIGISKTLKNICFFEQLRDIAIKGRHILGAIKRKIKKCGVK